PTLTAVCYQAGHWLFDTSGALYDSGTINGGYLPGHATLTFAVPVPPGTNEWHVTVEAWQVGRPYFSYGLRWRAGVARRLKERGIYDPDPKSYKITSPGFSRPPSNNGPQPQHSADESQPFRPVTIL